MDLILHYFNTSPKFIPLNIRPYIKFSRYNTFMNRVLEFARTKLNIPFSTRQVESCKIYEQLLLEWNERINLTAIRSHDEIVTKHFIDSLYCLEVMTNPFPTSLIDIGTGAGFPGLVLKIAIPSLSLVLVDSVGKKTAFCQHVVNTLKLDNVTVIQARAEEAGQDPRFRERFDWAVARAVANLPILSEYLLPLVRVKGCMLAQKGESGPLETQQAAFAISKLGGRLRIVHPVTLPSVAEQRYLIVVEKKHTTPPEYPRKVGIPTKKPIL
jgi:16S rRNA (guanine527-N7)-methyltransferase